MTNNRREIKFRAWLENGKKMVEVENITFHNKTISYSYQEDLCGDFYSEKADNFILMQYTGLKDTKDVEIYEGDIVKYYGKTYEIKWMFSGFYLHDPKGGFIELAECDECCEVVGNIYENPLLLEVKYDKYQEALDEMCCGCYTSCSKDGKPCLAYMKLICLNLEEKNYIQNLIMNLKNFENW